MLELRNVSRVYGDGAGAVAALRDVSLSVDPGQLVAVMGPSGSGKSTLLAIAGTLEEPSSGEVIVGGRPVTGASAAERARLRRRAIGFVFQDFNLLPGLTATENVALALKLDGVLGSRARAVADRALAGLGLADRAGIPAGWPATLSGLTAKVQSYTRGVIAAFAAQGTPVDMVSIGNEITNGMLWSGSQESNWSSFGCTGPGVGGLTWTSNTTATGWGSLAQLLKAGVAGAQAGDQPGHKLLIAVHSDLGGNNAKAQAFYSSLEAQGVPFDAIALSYYPIFQGSLAGLRSNVDELATRFRKPIVIAETEYSWTLANGDTLGNSTWEASQLIDGYPASPGGQLSMLNDELSILAAVPDGLGAGMFYWAPEWLPGVSWAPGASPPGTPDDNETLFNFQGQALPSIGMYSDPVQVCVRSNPYSTPCVIGS